MMNWIYLYILSLLTISVGSVAAVKNFHADLSLRHNDPLAKINDIQGNQYWVDLDLDYYYHKPFVDKEGKFNLSFRYNDSNSLAFSINEAKMTYLYNQSEVTYGVQTLDWVEIDSVWGLAKLNNAEYFDFFNPGKAGLPGVRFQYKPSSYVALDVFASILYIPQMNPMLNIDARKNTISSRSPWANVPSSEVENVSDPTQAPFKINYDIEIPKIHKLVFQPSAGVNLKFSPMDDLHFSGFLMRKPENRLGNSAQVFLENSDITAKITPEVYYHTLFGAQIASTFKRKSIKTYISYYTSIPTQKRSVIDDGTEGILNSGNAGLGIALEQYREDYLGVGVQQNKDTFSWELSYLARVSKFKRSSVLDSIPRWSTALNARLNWAINNKWATYFDIKYDIITFDRLSQATLSYKPLPNIVTELGFEVIGTPQSGSGFWVPYRENDSYFAQLKILF